jgi:methionine biosynthesis protein MetW
MNINDFDYEGYWESRGRSESQPRHTLIAGVVEEEGRVLDIGCGDGFLMELLRQSRKAHCQGLDISEASVRLAKERGLAAIVADVMADEFSVDPDYDYIVVCELLEHISDPETLIAKLKGCYKRALIVSVPNSAYFKHRLRLLFGRFPVQWGWHPSEHLRYWSVSDFRWWTGELGLEVASVIPANGLTVFKLYQIWPNLFANDVIYVLKESPGTAQ